MSVFLQNPHLHFPLIGSRVTFGTSCDELFSHRVTHADQAFVRNTRVKQQESVYMDTTSREHQECLNKS